MNLQDCYNFLLDAIVKRELPDEDIIMILDTIQESYPHILSDDYENEV